jgi:phenylacetate-coenzyme A ligase PaaK-like adenylate-forming protein
MPESDDLNLMLETAVYETDGERRQSLLLQRLNALTRYHYEHCETYRILLDKLETHPFDCENPADVPMLPVRLFKLQQLASVEPEAIVKTMTSSGTSGQQPSQIFLDKETAGLQTRVLSKIVSEFIGPKRLPMLVIDSRSTVTDRYKFSARTAGILGFSMFGRKTEYALNDDMSLDLPRVRAFLEQHADTPILMFGFTFIVWKHLVQQLESLQDTLPLDQGIMIHGGGWKQMIEESVTNHVFRERLQAVTGTRKVHNYYGMVEQTGSIFMECEHERLHTSTFSDIIIRDPADFKPLGSGESGLIQLVSAIPGSYPGHSLLSEDIGEIIDTELCPCGRGGTTFKVLGRIKEAEIRGCSDTYTQ